MYATIADVDLRITQSELLRLTDEDDIGEVNTDTINAALEAAGVMIDSYLAVRYSLPVSDPQPLLCVLAVDIAIWNLYSLDESGVPENRRERYQMAIKTLERISTGKQVLDSEESASSDSDASFSAPDRRFSRDTMKGL